MPFSGDLSTGAHPSLSVVVSMADDVQVVEQVLLFGSTKNMVLDEFWYDADACVRIVSELRASNLDTIPLVRPTVLRVMQDGV